MFRRQPEHFMKVCCKRMSIIFIVHLALASLYFSLYSFAECHRYDWNLEENKWVCLDHLEETKNSREHEDRIDIIATSSPSRTPNPSTVATTKKVVEIVLNVLSNILLPLIPGSFVYTVQTVLVD